MKRETVVGMRSEETSDGRPIRSLIRRLIRAPAMLSFIWPLMLIIGGYVVWDRWGAQYMTSKFNALEPTQIQVSPPPDYIRSDIVKKVYEDTAMEGLTLLDTQATAKIASAFSTHPWVRRVNSVRKLPGGLIDVRLDYRKPVAMVRVISRHRDVRGGSLFAVDVDGILLPTGDFTTEESNQYIHINVPGAYPTGANFGNKFGEQRVEAAARVAAIVAPLRAKAPITVVHVKNDLRQNAVPQMELETADGRTFTWGSAPGMEVPGESLAETKIKLLLLGVRNKTDLRIAVRPGQQTH